MANGKQQLAAKISTMDSSLHRFREIIDALPVAIYTTDAEGRLTHFNKAAVEFSGRVPELGTDKWCVTWKLFHPDGRPMPHDQCPMALAIKEGRSITGVEAIAERPDGKRIWFEPYPSPLYDKKGKITGGVNMLIDITERKESEKQQKRSEKELTDFFENATIGLHLVGPDGTILRANKAELDMLGYTEEEYIGQHIADFHADKEVIGYILEQLKSGKELHEQEATLKCKDGTIKNVIINSSVLWEDDKFIHTRCFTRDITRKKQAAKDLKKVTNESERQKRLYESIISSTPDLAYVFDLDYRFTFVNNSLLEMWGRSLEESIGKNLLEVGYEPWHAEMHEREIDEVITTKKPVRGEVSFTHATLGERFYDYIMVPVLNSEGEVEAVAGTTRDITVRKEAENALLESERRLRLALDAGQIGSWEWDIGNKTIMWSEKLEAIHGINTGEFDGKFESFLEIIHPDDREDVKSAIEKSLKEDTFFHVIHRWIRQDGRHIWVECNGQAVRDSKGEPQKMIGTCVDITVKKQNEELQKVQKKLLEQIATDTPLDECLSLLCSSVSELYPGVRASILITDEAGKKIDHIIAPDFNPKYKKVVEGLPVKDPRYGTCVEALLRGEPVDCSDIPNDETRSKNWRDFCMTNEFLACRSNPIKNEKGIPQGTFMICFNEVREPTEWEKRLSEIGTHIAGIALNRERSKQAQKASEERFRIMMEQSPLSMQIFDAEGRTIDVNPAWEKMWGASRKELADYNILKDEQLESAGLASYIRDAFAGKVAKLPITHYDPAKIGKPGRERWIEGYIYPLKLREGENFEVALVHHDVTENKKNEYNNALLGAIIDNSDDAIISKHLDGTITSWNAGAERLFGYTAEEAVGQSVLMLIPSERHDEELEFLEKIKNGKRIDHFETVRMRKDGALLNISLSISPVRDSTGNIVGASKIARDITNQKQAQEEREHLLHEIEREQKLLADVFRRAPSFMCILEGPDYKFKRTNELYLKLIGKENIIGKRLVEVLPEAKDQGFIELLDHVYNTGEAYSATDARLELEQPGPKENRVHFLDFVYQPIRNSKDEITGIFVQGVDLTERKLAKAELQAMNETLEERVKARTTALIAYQKQLRSLASQLSRAEENERQRLAAELHDNLGQILAVSKMKLDLLKKDFPSETNSDLAELVKLINESIRYTRELMTDLKPPPSLKKEDLAASLVWVADRMKKHNLEVTLEDDNEPKALEEEARTTLRQCVKELLFNVVKHSGTNKAKVNLSRKGNDIHVVIEDNGNGFNSNGKEPAPTKDGGFGLFSIRERMNFLSGTMDITSKPGKGTTVKLTAPLLIESDGSPKQSTDGDGEKTVNQASKKVNINDNQKTAVLLVDDHQMMRKGLQRMIDSQDDLMVIAEVADGNEALRVAKETLPNIIVMDVNMPGMNGIEATREISAILPHVRIIGLSLHDNKDVAEAMRSAGAAAYLTKSEAFETLCATIRSEAQLAKDEEN